jgi:hypothetical protein
VTAGLTDGVNDSVVSEGEYDFWSYESFLSTSSQDSNALSFETQLEAAFPQFSTLPAADLNVSRTVDGGPLSQN